MDTLESSAAIAPRRLAETIAGGAALTILDLRADASWTIEGPRVTVRHEPSPSPEELAGELAGPVVVICNRGVTARSVAASLRALGVDAVHLDGGMRAWIGTLVAHPVALAVPGLEVRQVQRPGRGCLSYVLAARGAALVVDPAPDAGFYVALAAELGARITDIVDTHLHADHLSGARALAELTGATLRLPAPALERGVAYRFTPLSDGDAIELGGVSMRAIALPGHTSDMTGVLVADRALIGGDSVFADAIARPDLQYGDSDGARTMGRLLHSTVERRVLALPGDAILLPGHDHPVVRATAVAPRIGELRARLPELAIADADEFAAALLADMPPRPANYESVIAVNAGTRPFDPDLETGGNSCATR
jgi:glyoxylase-like metal-dependent hydrolase (beta-lactamase superfamily II)